jgi:mono/diheme cytochrome c family protein
MPGYADKLSNEEMADLVNYMRQTWGGRPGDVTAAQVAEQVKIIEHSK